jgi:hypothetical protein
MKGELVDKRRLARARRTGHADQVCPACMREEFGKRAASLSRIVLDLRQQAG